MAAFGIINPDMYVELLADGHSRRQQFLMLQGWTTSETRGYIPMRKDIMEIKTDRRDENRELYLVIVEEDHEVAIPVRAAVEYLASIFTLPVDVAMIEGTSQAIWWTDGRMPLLVTITRQETGSLYLRPEGSYGTPYPEERLQGEIYPLDALDVLYCRWIQDCRKRIEQPEIKAIPGPLRKRRKAATGS